MSDLSRLQRLSAQLYWGALALSVVLPLIVLVYAGRGVTEPASLLSLVPELPAGTPVSPAQAGLVAGVSLVAVLPLVAALRRMVRLFANYRAGEVLSAENAEAILGIGRNLSLAALFSVLVPTLERLILSWHAPQRVLSIALDDGTLGYLIAAGLLTVIGWAMAEAARVKAENEGFV